ncbi:MAG: hypothetical protein JNM35_16040 [Nitrospira sp.]|nr:hypothetical protein [Nitrospira sp.]
MVSHLLSEPSKAFSTHREVAAELLLDEVGNLNTGWTMSNYLFDREIV